MPGSEVKGAWLMTARRYILQDCGQEVFARYVAAAPEESREAVGEPVVSRWYPETVMRDALESFYREVAGRDAERFTSAMERCTVLGTHGVALVRASVAIQVPEWAKVKGLRLGFYRPLCGNLVAPQCNKTESCGQSTKYNYGLKA